MPSSVTDPEGFAREMEKIRGKKRPGDVAPVSFLRSFPCPHEGRIVHGCTTGSCGHEWRHLRQCKLLDESAEILLCVRGRTRPTRDDVEVVSCSTCQHHPNYPAEQERDRKRAAAIPPRPNVVAVNPTPELVHPAPPPIHPDATDTGDSLTRHLCLHIYPVAGRWQETLTEILAKLPLFNGRRLAAVMTSESDEPRPLDPPEAVEARLAGRGFEFFRLPNRPTGEVVSWRPLLSRLRPTAGANDVVYWCHTKGVTKPADNQPVRWWREAMVETTLSDWPLVRETLSEFPVAGSFLITGRERRSPKRQRRVVGMPWHYSGNFFWVRLSDLFSNKRWDRPRQQYGGIEFLPGRLFSADQAGVLFHRFDYHSGSLYVEDHWKKTVLPELAEWRRRRLLRALGLAVTLRPTGPLATNLLHLKTFSP
jgi:hypothetical protein